MINLTDEDKKRIVSLLASDNAKLYHILMLNIKFGVEYNNDRLKDVIEKNQKLSDKFDMSEYYGRVFNQMLEIEKERYNRDVNR